MTQYALDGVRVLDLTQIAAGPYGTYLLSSLGAEVIKVESNRRPDFGRGPVKPTGIPQQMEQYPGGEPGERPWNRTSDFNQRNRGKLGITLDFSRPEGREAFKRLAAKCDALIENFRASVLERQGLGWDALREVNPKLVYVKLSSQGDTGPERDYGSLGTTMEQTGGLASITGYEDGIPLLTNETYPDPVAGIVSVGALIAGLRQARRTGHAQFIDFSQREMTVSVFTEAMMDYALNGRVQGPVGNRHPSAVQGVYRCAGEDGWIAIGVESDEQLAALRSVMGDPAWAQDGRFETVVSCWAHQDEFDANLSDWTGGFEHRDLMVRLQEAGVPAGAILTGEELLTDPHLVARDWWEWLAPTDVGEPHRFVAAPWRISGSPYRPLSPAPCLGEHNDAVFLDVAGLDPGEYAKLQADGIVSTEPMWEAR